jgi:hypothetical protein
MLRRLQPAEEKDLLRLRQHDLRMKTQLSVQPRGSGALWPKDEEIGETLEIQLAVRQLYVVELIGNRVGNQRQSSFRRLALRTNAVWLRRDPIPAGAVAAMTIDAAPDSSARPNPKIETALEAMTNIM